jgi:hypothetical protein
MVMAVFIARVLYHTLARNRLRGGQANQLLGNSEVGQKPGRYTRETPKAEPKRPVMKARMQGLSDPRLLAQAEFSRAKAMPIPPLTQRVATPRLAFRFSIS